MPLFQLPFYLNNVLQGVVAGLSAAAIFAIWAILADRNVWCFRNLTNIFIAWRMGNIDEPRRFPLFKKIMFSIAAIFVISSVFYTLVFVGVIQNGDRPPFPTVEEFIRQQERK